MTPPRLSLLFCTALLGACSLFGAAKPPTTAMKSLRVIAFPAANDRMATAVDVVFVYRDEARALLPARAPEWFARRNDIVHAQPGALEVLSYEVPPNQRVEAVRLSARHRRALRVVAYANHVAADGQHPVELTPLRHPVVWLDAVTVGATEADDFVALGEDER